MTSRRTLVKHGLGALAALSAARESARGQPGALAPADDRDEPGYQLMLEEVSP